MHSLHEFHAHINGSSINGQLFTDRLQWTENSFADLVSSPEETSKSHTMLINAQTNVQCAKVDDSFSLVTISNDEEKIALHMTHAEAVTLSLRLLIRSVDQSQKDRVAVV